jgi:hypothetical protein
MRCAYLRRAGGEGTFGLFAEQLFEEGQARGGRGKHEVCATIEDVRSQSHLK